MKQILIVEDDPIIAGIYRTKYAHAGFETQTATDGEMALELLKTFKPDLIHLDLMIPKINGVDVIKRVRGRPASKSLPIVVLSNTYQNHLVKAAMAAGATECVSKAVCTPNLMLQTVNKVLARSAASDAAPAVAIGPAAASPVSGPAASTSRGMGVFGTDVDVTFQAEIRRGFLERGPAMLSALGERVKTMTGMEIAADRTSDLFDLWRATHSLAGNAGIAGFKDLSQMSSALEALLKELMEKPKHITASSLRTIADAQDFLTILFERGAESGAEAARPAIVLVVDDEVMSRRAVSLAVARLNISSVSVDDPQVALRLLPENRFSLIFLDVDMPGMNGYELCAALRQMPANKETPVVFVTSLTGFESRDRATASGGNDVIAKPFLSMELAVKALTHILRAQPV